MPPSWNTDELTLMAFRRCWCPTISVTNTWRAGLSITVTMPTTKAIAQMCHASTTPGQGQDGEQRATAPRRRPA